MTSRNLPKAEFFVAFALLVLGPSTLFAQGPLPDAPKLVAGSTAGAVATPVLTTPRNSSTNYEAPHRFFDKWNIALFAGSAALDATDFAITRSNLQSNGKELNPVVRIFGRSSAGLAVNFGGEAVSTVALSYFFHRTHHYRLERMVSVVNIGASAGAVSYSSTHH